MYDLTLHQVVLRVFAFLVIIATHGAATSVTAVALGDEGVKHDGRLSASPINHLDIVGFIAAIVGLFGWAKPVAVDPARLRGGGLGLVAIVFAGSLACLAGGTIALALRPFLVNALPDSAATNVFALIQVFAEMSFATAIFNLLPIPPLAGALFLVAMAQGLRDQLPRIGFYAGFVLLGPDVFGVWRAIFWPAIEALMNAFLG